MKVTNNPTPNPYQSNPLEQSKAAANKAGKTIANDGTHTGQATGHLNGASVEISDNARLMRDASQVAKSAPDLRKEKVAALKKSIQEGNYHVDARDVADRLVDEHLNSNFGKNTI